MNRPITSPWSAVLTSSPTITLTPYSAAFAARVVGAGDLVVVGDRDRAEADLDARWRAARRPGSRSRWSGRCACADRLRSACASRPARGPRAWGPGRGGARRARGRSSSTSSATRDQASSPRAAAPASTSLCAQLVVADRALELLGQHVDVAQLEVQPEVAVAQDLLVDRHARRQRHRTGAERLDQHAGRGHLAQRGRDDDVRAVRTRPPRRRPR